MKENRREYDGKSSTYESDWITEMSVYMPRMAEINNDFMFGLWSNEKESVMGKLFRQGDVLLELVSKNIKDIKTALDEGRINLPKVLAYGEKTGHMHKIVEKIAEDEYIQADDKKARVIYKNGTLFIEVFEDHNLVLGHVKEKEGVLRKAEHGDIKLNKGIYKVHQQREYDEKEIRRVAD